MSDSEGKTGKKNNTQNGYARFRFSEHSIDGRPLRMSAASDFSN
jgi:hypothetical protein